MTTTRKNTSTHKLLSLSVRYDQQTLDRVVTTTEIRTLDLHFVGRTLHHCISKVLLHMLPGPVVRIASQNVVTPVSVGTNAIDHAGSTPLIRSGRRLTGCSEACQCGFTDQNSYLCLGSPLTPPGLDSIHFSTQNTSIINSFCRKF